MPIAIDPSAPPLVQGNGSAKTTASFTPPANSLLVSCSGFGGNTPPTITNTGPALTWTRYSRAYSDAGNGIVRGSAAIAVAPCLTSQAMTVTATSPTTNDGGGHQVFVLTGVDLTAPIGAVTRVNAHNVSPYTPTLYTSTVTGSRAVFIANNWYIVSDVVDAPAVGIGYTSSRVGGIIGYMGADTPTPGTPIQVTIHNDDVLGDYNLVAIEVLPAGGGPAPAAFQGFGVPI